MTDTTDKSRELFKEIPLTQGKVALVDAKDYDFLNHQVIRE